MPIELQQSSEDNAPKARRAFESRPLPDNEQWTNRFEIASSSSDRIYTIAQNKVKRHWACSCPGWKSKRKCKHLVDLGLPNHEVPFELKVAKKAPVYDSLPSRDIDILDDSKRRNIIRREDS